MAAGNIVMTKMKFKMMIIPEKTPKALIGMAGLNILAANATAVVLAVTVGGMLFLAGAKLWQCILLLLSGVGMLAALALLTPYRMKRLVTFLDPWKDQFDSGYQLTQSLIAFGRGEWFGLGMGNSIQR